jgi:hypothetical protein
MPTKKGERPLKVCHTCRYWSYRYKGFCQHLNQGVGRFWICEEWRGPAEDIHHLPETGNAAAAGPPDP